MNSRTELSADAKLAKAKTLLNRLKAKGVLNVKDIDALLSALNSRYGDRTYDIVLNCVNRPYEVMKALGQEGTTSAKTLQYFADHEISAADLEKALNSTANTTSKTKTTTTPVKASATPPAPQREVLTPIKTFIVPPTSSFKTEKIDILDSGILIKRIHPTEVAWQTPIMSPTLPGENELAVTELNRTMRLNPNALNSNQEFSLKELREKAGLTDEDIRFILGDAGVKKSTQGNIYVTREAALYLMERKILRENRQYLMIARYQPSQQK